MKKMVLLIAVATMLTFGSFGYAAVVDVIQAPTDYFVPTDGQKYDSPYYRWYNEDWGWTHNAISGTFTSATLNISAFDVDNEDPSNTAGEHDKIYAYDTDTSTWILLGELAGATDIWSYTTFNLNLATWGNEINTGLKVFMDIDTTHNEQWWAVTLAKSVLNLDEGTIPDPEPGAPVPEPATMLLLGSGLVGLAGFARRRFKK